MLKANWWQVEEELGAQAKQFTVHEDMNLDCNLTVVKSAYRSQAELCRGCVERVWDAIQIIYHPNTPLRGVGGELHQSLLSLNLNNSARSPSAS